MRLHFFHKYRLLLAKLQRKESMSKDSPSPNVLMAEEAVVHVQQATVAKDSSAADLPLPSYLRRDSRCLQQSPHLFLEALCSAERVCDRLLRSNLRLGPLHLILLADIRVRYDLSGNRARKEGASAPCAPHGLRTWWSLQERQRPMSPVTGTWLQSKYVSIIRSRRFANRNNRR